MRLTQTQEWTLVAALIVYIAFTPGFQAVRTFLSTQVGKAAGLAIIAYVWKNVSALVALLLTVSFIRCSGIREGMESPSAKSCPAGFTAKSDQPGKCSKKEGDTEIVVDAQEPPKTPAVTPPAATPTATAAPLTVPKDAPVAPPAEVVAPPMTEGFEPMMKEPMKGGCAFSPL
jgi:hypothetical protein